MSIIEQVLQEHMDEEMAKEVTDALVKEMDNNLFNGIVKGTDSKIVLIRAGCRTVGYIDFTFKVIRGVEVEYHSCRVSVMDASILNATSSKVHIDGIDKVWDIGDCNAFSVLDARKVWERIMEKGGSPCSPVEF